MFDALVQHVWLIPALPLAAAITTAALGPKLLRERSHWPCVVAAILAAIISISLLFVSMASQAHGRPAVEAGEPVSLVQPASSTNIVYHWITVGEFDVPIALRFDPLTALMLAMVTGVGSLIVVYSIGYMRGDPGDWRFFAEVALFLFCMTMLVLASNFLLIYVFWEGVGLCSYLLIGFWYERPAASAAAKKAFLVNRIGDFGFALGVLLTYRTFGSLDYDHVFAVAGSLSAAVTNGGDYPQVAQAVPIICLLFFCGAIGKSAQFPLHVWLPDAMEGPTPVSALIHAATMVTAGVYMVARFTPLFGSAPGTNLVVALVGGFTALLAAAIALSQNDLKRILAYSTISQLGYMFLALGCGTTVGVIAAIFHVFTHAFFKALLFLAAGSVMHAMGNVIDIRRFGGLRRRLPITCVTFACGAASLAGFPGLSGFWSKDEILAATAERAQIGSHPIVFSVLLGVGLVTAFLTACYTFRAFFKTFWGDEVLPSEAGDHAHESPPVMYYPLIVLAIFSLLVGWVLGPSGVLSDFLGRTPGWPRPVAEHAPNHSLMLIASLMALSGIGLAWWLYGRRSSVPEKLAERFPAAYELSKNKFWFDEIYDRLVVRPILSLASASLFTDNWVVDGLVRLVAATPRLVGRMLLRPIQNGLVQFYALAMLGGLAFFLVVALLLGG